MLIFMANRLLKAVSPIFFWSSMITVIAVSFLYISANYKIVIIDSAIAADLAYKPIARTHIKDDGVSNNSLNSKYLSYNQVFNSKIEPERSIDFHDSKFDGSVIEWKAKISAAYTQITGIKFCVIDNEHQNIDIDKPCDWFWAFNEVLMDADNTEVNPEWDGLWVNYILNYYKVPFNKDLRFYDDIYTVKGIVDGLDCGVDIKCIPNIDIISITK